MARKIEVEILGDSRSLERAFLRSSQAGRGFSDGMKKAAVAGVAGLAVFSVAAGKAVVSASNLQEQVNKSDVIFEKNADEVRAWSKELANAFGISQREGLAAAAGFGQILQTSGLAADQSADFSKKLVELAGDMASFNDISTTDALDKLRAGLVGEAEPLRRVGVLLSEAAVKEEAYASGIAKRGEELTDQQKVLARYNIILEQTAKQQGDVERTSGSLANVQRRLRAQFEDMAASVGSFLLPAVASAGDALSDLVNDLGAERTVQGKIRVVLDRVRGIAEFGRGLTQRIGDAIATIDWDAAWDRAQGIADGFQAKLEAVDFAVIGQRLGDAFESAADRAIPAARDIAERLSEAVRTIDWEDLGKNMGPGLAAAVVTAFVTLIDPVFWAKNWDLALSVALVAFTGPIGRLAGRLGAALVGAIGSSLGRLAPRFADLFRGLAIQAVRGFSFILPQIQRVLNLVIGRVAALFGRLRRIASFAIRVLGVQAVINQISGLVSKVGDAFGAMGAAIKQFFEDLWDDLERGAIRAALAIIEPFTHIPKGFGWAQDLKREWKAQLDGMVADTTTATGQIQSQLDGIQGKTVSVVVATSFTGDLANERPGAGSSPNAGGGPAATGLANQITAGIDAAIEAAKRAANERIKQANKAIADSKKRFATALEGLQLKLDEAKLTPGFQDDQRVLSQIQALVTRQIGIEGKTIELGNLLVSLRQDRASVAEGRAQAASDAFSEAIDRIQLKIDAASFTKGFADDYKRNTELQNAIKAQIAQEGRTTALVSQLAAARQARRDIADQEREAAKAAAQKRQFNILGLDETGNKPLPGIANLKKQLGSLESRVQGTPLDTNKTAAMFARIRRLFKQEGKNLTDETKAWVRDWLDTLRTELGQGGGIEGPLTKTTRLNSKNLLKGLGLDPEEIRGLKSRLSNFNSAGMALAQSGTVPNAAYGINLANGNQTINLNVEVKLDRDTVGRAVKRFNANDKRHNPQQKRGPNAGRR